MIATRICTSVNGSEVFYEYYEFIFNPFHILSATIRKIDYIEDDDPEDYDPGTIELIFKTGQVIEIIYEERIYLKLKKLFND